MLNHISIKDFAIIRNTEVDFHPGLNILTGETGAGKSIIIEAVSLALGARADTAFVRSGTDKAVVQLTGDIDGMEIVITREVSASGKNLCRLNGEIVTLANLSTYCRKLADIHGEYDQQSILNPDYHINLVDLYRHDEIVTVKDKVYKLYTAYKTAKSKLASLLSNAAKNERKRDFMAFELNEIQSAQLTCGEDTELEERISLLQNSEKIYRSLSEAYAVSTEESPSVIDALSRVSQLLQEAAPYGNSLSNLSTSFDDLFYQLEDVCRNIRNAKDEITFSPEELDELIARMDTIDKLKRKYGNTIEEILEYAAKIEKDLELIENIDEEKDNLKIQIDSLEKQLSLSCQRLSVLRKESAAELETKISKELAELNFANSTIEISFTELSEFTENGTDKVEFLISTNRGEPVKPLTKIASGGEMARIMLAFKKIIADYDKIPTLIFDEIDSGISGITASIVGKKLREIAQNHQIICITHLPQIAACGTHNFMIHKETADDVTKTSIIPLSKEEKKLEIARLLGGSNITETTLKSAEELISASE